MKISGVAVGIIAIVLGVLVLVFKDILQLLVGISLIVFGLIAIVRRT